MATETAKVIEHARQDDGARARRAEEGDRGGVGRYRCGSGRGRGARPAGRRRRRRAPRSRRSSTSSSTRAGDKKIQVIKVVRAITGLGLKRRRTGRLGPQGRQGGRRPGGGRLDQVAAQEAGASVEVSSRSGPRGGLSAKAEQWKGVWGCHRSPGGEAACPRRGLVERGFGDGRFL